MSTTRAERIGIAGLRGLGERLKAPGASDEPSDGRGRRASHLVVARESDEFDSQMLEGMVLQTLHRYDEIDLRDELVDLGGKPVKQPAEHGALVIEEGRTRAVLFRRGRTWCLYSQGSAAKADVNGDNGFCRILVRVFEELRPKNVYLATFSRVVRSQEFSSSVMSAAKKHVGTIHCRETKLDMQDPQSLFFFGLLSAFSDLERTQQMTRLMLGLLAKHDRGEWLRGPQAVPLGYRLVDRRVVPDPRARHVVARMLDLMCHPGHTSATMMASLAELRVASPSQTGSGWAYMPEDGGDWGAGDEDLRDALAAATAAGRSLATVHEPKGYAEKFFACLELYRTGSLGTTHVSPAAVDRLGRHKVLERVDRKGNRVPYVALTLELGLPPGGWTTPEVLERVVQKQAERSARSRGSTAAKRLLPLLGRPARWSADGRLWTLQNGRGQSNTYCVVSIDERTAARMRPSRPGGAFDGWDRGGRFNGRIDARLPADELHRQIAAAAADAFRDGVEVRVLPSADRWPERPDGLVGLPHAGPEDDPAVGLAEDLATARTAAGRAALTYQRYTGGDEDHSEILRLGSEEASAAVGTARRRLERALAREPDPDAPPPPVEVTAPADLLLGVLGRLGRTPGAVPRHVAEATGRVVRDLRVTAGPVWADWSATLHVPTSQGVLVLGPLAGQVRNHLLGAPGPRKARSDKGANRTDAKLDAYLAESLGRNLPVRELAGRNAAHGRRVRLDLAARLQRPPYGMARNSAETIMACPLPVTRRAVWDLLQEVAPDPSLPDGFAEHLRTVYLGPVPPSVRKWWLYVRSRDDVTALFLARGGDMLACHAKGAFRDAGVPDWFLTDLTSRAGGRRHLVRVPNPQGKVAGCCKWTSCRSDLLSLVPCPHCGGWATVAARVPEVGGGLLCPRCLRMPVPGSPVFPPEYALLTDAYVQEQQRGLAPDLAPHRDKAHARKARAREGLPPRQYGGGAGNAAPREPAPAGVRKWASAEGIRLKPNIAVPGWVLDRYEEAVQEADLRAHTPYLPRDGSAREVRAWARAAGMDVPAAGRLPTAVWDAYRAALLAR